MWTGIDNWENIGGMMLGRTIRTPTPEVPMALLEMKKNSLTALIMAWKLL